ncbi:MAG: chalcone isomerase family protein [Kiritimatiellae bacterium]|jgi:hypothetical protein|nr:chalcone isomerase family protein [Kiritimatiellia bacterium]NLD90000.1 hypothetical protein [Lentisphaerota bacterium]HOU20992.1 chalcone isomerase family protein [Kiritimatiellia bacterium]HQQ60562.1 chalcone isomerase family protein [Kiritimatiellia bacterium]
MKKILFPVLLLACAMAAPAAEDLVLNGSGLRTKPIFGAMYELSLNVPAGLKGSDAKTLIESDQPMELVLLIKSGLITRKRFVDTTEGGFAKAAQSGYASEKTTAFLDQFANTEFKKGDTVVMRQSSEGLSTLYRKQADASETTLGTIAGLDLKQALFAIWLGDSPVQASLKKALLGGQ